MSVYESKKFLARMGQKALITIVIDTPNQGLPNPTMSQFD